EMLAREPLIWATIKEELIQIKEKYGEERRTRIRTVVKELTFRPEDLIKKEEIVVTTTHHGYIKYTPLRAYKRQRRGGKGMSGMAMEKGDFVEDLFITHTHSILLFFTNLGKVHWARAYEIPQKKRSAKGRALVNFLSLGNNEKVSTTLCLDNFDHEGFLLMATKRGKVKKTVLSAYSRPKKGGIAGIHLEAEDELIKVMLTQGEEDIVLVTKKGKAIVFSEKDVRPTGRISLGVKGISLAEEDEVMDAVVASEDEALFTITSKGYGKRTLLAKYRKTRRGGKGIINLRFVPHKGEVVGAKRIKRSDELIAITRKGKSIRLAAKNISLIGRNTSGPRIIRLEEDDEVIALA
ncbi:MAG: DNA gyrase C-terminal beta-propeller domain-containing protein, partial [bacterium]